MTSKSNHAKYICGIRDAIQGSSDETNLQFIVGSLSLYEQCYGSQNKENFRKFLNDALAVYGPGTTFESDDRVLPLYILLGKYSRSSTPAEIFDRMNETGAYRFSAKFYVEWSKVFNQAGHSTRAKEILCEGLKRKAKPNHLIVAGLTELGYSVDENNEPRSARKKLTPSSAKHSARKQLFPKEAERENIRMNQSEGFVLPTLPSDPSAFDPSHRDVTEPLSILPSLPTFESQDRPEFSDSERSEDAENVRPPGAPREVRPKRKTAGILVPAAGFQLEDYDLYSNDEDEKKSEKEEANRINIENNILPSPSRRPLPTGNNSAAPSPSRRQLFPVVLPEPVLPTRPVTPPVAVDDEECFRNGTEALKDLRHDSESDSENEPRRLTGFEKKRKSWMTRLSLAASTTKPRPEPLEAMFSKMAVNSPSTSKS